jgi:tRNA(fMet)-specific endonuclease VapC
MRAIMLDTQAYAAFKRGDADMVAVLQRCPDILICSTVLGELLAGFAAGERAAEQRSELAQFMQSPRVRVVAQTETTADNYAMIYSQLRRKSRPMPTNDLWIAASALEHGSALLTTDAHFGEIDGLRCGRQLSDFLQ